MSFREKQLLVNILSTLLISACYYFYVFHSHDGSMMDTNDLLVFWAKTLLILIPVTMVAKIVIHIIFTVTNTVATREKIPPKDERDKLIELRSSRIGQYTFGLGFVLSMVTLVFGMSVNTMFIVIIGSGILSEVLDNGLQLYFFRQGI